MSPQSTTNQRLRVTIIGAGVSGILMAIKLQQYLPNHTTFHIYEKSPEIGGTWFENRYPGCACDVPSHLYQYSFAPNTDWSRFYATSREIQSYLESVVRQYNLTPHISFNSLVTHASWSGSRGLWTIEVSSHGTVESEILINAGGILNNLQMPDIPGLDTFRGPQLHTAAWDDSVDLTGKRVAIIGAGASAVQVVPEVRKIAKHVDVYIRTPSWISPPVALPAGVEKGHIYSEEEKKSFRVDGKGYRSMRKGLEDQFNSMFGAFTKGSVEQQDLRGRFEGRMKALIKAEALQKKLIPSFEAGCRRINPGEEYLIALQEENVRPVFERIERIDSDGVVLGNGVKHEADVLIAATGFNTSFRPRFPILGTGGVNLQDLWEEDPTSYCGIAVSGFPNYLMFLGPNTPISNGSLMGPLEATSDYITRLLRKTIRQRVKSFDIRADVQADFNKHTQALMQNMVWTGTCRSWFKNSKSGKITALWPGSSLHYMQTLAEDRWEDYNWEFQGSRFDYLGRGFSWIEDPAGDVLGREESEKWRMSTVPNKESDLSYYLVDAVPLAKKRDEKALL
ncbi:FAD/NAD(P)-binding domain-containing protein [Aspergillus pseudodeflectus]|uniref:FAD/NAD(P)-binding domain-containing protein n=1 Tax=Aspergillus pseudodeflectus TaxID=176178 RepID=A0ABR4L6Z0_9EURO